MDADLVQTDTEIKNMEEEALAVMQRVDEATKALDSRREELEAARTEVSAGYIPLSCAIKVTPLPLPFHLSPGLIPFRPQRCRTARSQRSLLPASPLHPHLNVLFLQTTRFPQLGIEPVFAARQVTSARLAELVADRDLRM